MIFLNRAELVFKAIDVLGNPLQNSVRYENVCTVKDISYGEAELNRGDLYYNPDILNDGKKHPLIVYYHGGGFLKGDKKYRVTVSEYYAKEGYFVFCVNYRMPPEVEFRGLIKDCVDALNFTEKLAEKYNFDMDNIVLTGDSSGGYIASYLAALKYNDVLCEKFECNVEPRLKGLMLMCGIYDLEVLLKGNSLMGVIPVTAGTIFNRRFKKDLSDLKEIPEYDYISPSKFVNEKWCSTFICWSDDDIICQGQGEPMGEKLKAVVPLYEQYHVPGIMNNHCFHLMPPSNRYARECMEKSLEFLSELFSERTVTI